MWRPNIFEDPRVEMLTFQFISPDLFSELVIISEVEPSWHAEDDFINAHLSRALDLDGKRSSHAVEVPCPNPEMINQIFDAIS